MGKGHVIEINIGFFRILTTVLLAVSFVTRVNLAKLPWIFPYLVTAPLLLVFTVLYFKEDNEKIRALIKTIFLTATIPYLAAMFYSVFIWLIGQSPINSGTRAMSITIQFIDMMLLVILTFSHFRKQTVDIIENAVIISYAFSIWDAFMHLGGNSIIQYILQILRYGHARNEIWFEMHDIGLSVGFFLIYEIFIMDKFRLIRIVLLFMVMLMCYKRIAIFALLVVVIICIITRSKVESFMNFRTGIIMYGVFAATIIYIMLISSGAIYNLFEAIGVNFSGRKYLFDYMKKFYKWSVFFMGQGLGFTGKYLTLVSNLYIGRAAKGFMQVHNDILKTYIDLGFIGSLLWFFWYLIKAPQIIGNRFGNEAKFFYCMVTIYSYIVYTTDNTSGYFLFQIALYSIITLCCYESIEKNDVI